MKIFIQQSDTHSTNAGRAIVALESSRNNLENVVASSWIQRSRTTLNVLDPIGSKTSIRGCAYPAVPSLASVAAQHGTFCCLFSTTTQSFLRVLSLIPITSLFVVPNHPLGNEREKSASNPYRSFSSYFEHMESFGFNLNAFCEEQGEAEIIR